ncbi:hypothetical protein D770_04135 [Flammeovirgaceae bacterium 311]|nr:hypothetical protein D770_04135 [Flammeovirgaceae bacterium 311]
MTFNKVIRTVFPPIIGYLTFLLCDGIFQKFFPTKPPDDLSIPGIVFLLEYLEYVIMFAWAALVFTFQYKVVVPNTFSSVKKAIILAIFIGLGISLFFAFMHYHADKATLDEAITTFFRVFLQVESFALGNLVLISIFNVLTNTVEAKREVI